MLRQRCGRCGNRVYFDNWSCLACGARLGLRPDLMHMAALAKTGGGWWADAEDDSGPRYRMCGNSLEHAICNGILREEEAGNLCRACRFTQHIPSLTMPGHLEYWRRLERAKRRLLFTLAALELPLVPRSESAGGLGFAFGADLTPGQRFMTSHADGVISINIAEADDVERERLRNGMGEPYRTLLGHLRHESGHYYLSKLREVPGTTGAINAQFGDVDSGYHDALTDYYAGARPSGWTDHYISAYATAHPQEDWAETWAHYLLITDTLQSAAQAGVEPVPSASGSPAGLKDSTNFDRMLARWLPLAEFANELSRSLGSADAYPFVLSATVATKLSLIDRLVRASCNRLGATSGMRVAEIAAPCRETVDEEMGVASSRSA